MKQGLLADRIWFLSLAAAMGGFLFGYDTAVINGGEQQIQSVWSLSPEKAPRTVPHSAELITQPCITGESDHTD